MDFFGVLSVDRVIDVQHLIYCQGQHVCDALFLHVGCISNLELSFHLTSLALIFHCFSFLLQLFLHFSRSRVLPFFLL
jgi:hypothetical protein